MARLALAGMLSYVFLAGSLLQPGLASQGDTDPAFQNYLQQCALTGCLKSVCISGCVTTVEQQEILAAAGAQPQKIDGLKQMKLSKNHEQLLPPIAQAASDRKVTEPEELVVTKWDCYNECKFQSMVLREKESAEAAVGGTPEPIKYYGKWPFTRTLGLQEPASVLFSLLNLLATLFGLLCFVSAVFFQLPRKPYGDKGPLYEYAGLVIIYGLLQANAWIWSTIFHARDVVVTERLDYTSAIVLLGISLILAIIRTASLRVEAARVMVAAPVIAFLTTHILYLNFYDFYYGWNMLVCTVIGVVQLLLWSFWAGATRHPSALKVWLVALGTGFSLLLELYDFPPLYGVLDAHSLWHAATIPLTVLWWSFFVDDAKFRTKVITTKAEMRSEKRRSKAQSMKKTD